MGRMDRTHLSRYYVSLSFVSAAYCAYAELDILGSIDQGCCTL
jgi:hypothetical protein